MGRMLVLKSISPPTFAANRKAIQDARYEKVTNPFMTNPREITG
jgi:hypothetical protein